ncbi:MAG: hypothetical protein ABIS50_23295 [Luteolibacter sp.]|uniref:hypothetical protein n=1 Tax=Luteolibacter sp. TaxID=1962973 RepID=UPI0032656B3C
MKIPNFFSRYGIIIAGVAIVILAGLSGNLKGRADAKAAGVSANNSRHRPVLEPERESSAGSSRPGYDAIRKRLNLIWQESPDPTYDFEMLAEMERLLGKMTSAEIAEFLRSIPPGFERRAPYFQMGREIVCWWTLKDGPAALAYLGSQPDVEGSMGRILTTQTFMLWAADQPEAALTWLRSGDLTKKQRESSENLLLNATITMVETDPERAFQQLAYLAPDKVADYLGIWAGCVGENPEMRQKLLDRAAATGRPEDLARVRNSMVAKWATMEPDAALAYVDSLQVTDLERQNLDMSLAAATARKDPKAALDTWLERNASATVIPDELNKIVGAWMMPGPDAAAQWLDGLPAGVQRDAIYSGSIRALTGFDQYSKAAELANHIESPEYRAKALQTLDKQWSLSQPDAAVTWKAGLSPEDQAVLQEK